MITIVIVEDHAIVRAGLGFLIGACGDMKIIGESGFGREALNLVRTLQPNVLLLDLDLPDMDGLDIIPQSRRVCPETAVLILSMFESEDLAARALQAGAVGYIIKGTDPAELPKAIRNAAEGKPYITESIRDRMLLHIHQGRSHGGESVSLLSDRERTVLIEFARGNNIPGIAEKLCLSASTVKSYKKRVQEKLGLETISDFVKFAIKNELIEKF
jgi:DNA-binding NarL/FixJ family response regulator